MKLKLRCMEVLNEEERERIWQAALRVWARVPLRAPGPEEFMQALRDYGCEISGDRISFPDEVRQKTLARIAEVREANGPARAAEVDSDHVSYCTNAQASFCCDLETETLRRATTADLAQWSWICDLYPEMGRAHPTYIPQDVPLHSCDVHTFATIILNSSRPCRVSVFDADMIPYFIALQAVCDGSVAPVRERPVFNTMCYVNSPFTISPEAIQIGMRARELLGRPFRPSAMPVAGTATPATIAGALVQSTAECLALNVVTLALDDRVTGWTEGPVSFDMKSGLPTANGPDAQLLRLAASQMAAHVFGGEFRGSGALNTTAKVPCVQAVMEKGMDAMWGFCTGVRSFASLGILATSDAAGITQLMLDLEIISHLQRLAKGIAFDEDRLAEELICEVAPRGAYFLDQDHTARYFREELWIPELMDRRVPAAWVQDPVTMLENARAKAHRIAAEAKNRCPLTDEQRRQVAAIVAEADATK